MVTRIDASMISALDALIETRLAAVSGGKVDVGDYVFSSASAKPKFLICDGAAYSRTTHAALFAKIGVAFGAGDGTTTFNVPNAAAHFPLLAGSFAGMTTRVIGARGGAEAHVLTEAEMPKHSHGVGRNMSGAMQGSNEPIPVSSLNNLVNTSEKGDNQPHNNMPPFLVIGNLIIYSGV